jgi:VanZ family protein
MNSEKPIIATHRTFLINSALGLLLVFSIPLLLTGDFDLYQHRLSPFIWNAGHIFVFFALIWLALNLYKFPTKPGFLGLFVIVNIAVLLLGLGIEEIQSRLGRQSSIDDVYKNCLGASLAILFHPKIPPIGHSLRSVLRIVALSLLTIALYPLTINTVDWIYARANFPVLSNLESPFEIERWNGENMLVLNSDSYVLQHEFDDAMYSSVSLLYFPGNWEGYHCFSFRIFNPGSTEVPLRIRINDRQHDETDQNYFDRFNYSLKVLPGRNDFAIDLSTIQDALRGRLMDMTKVEKIMFFTSRLKNGATLSFDDLELIDGQEECQNIQL